MIPGVRHTELVLLGALGLTLPALPPLFDGGLSPAAALVRFAIALVICWACAAVLEGLVDTYGRQARQRQLEEQIRQLRASREIPLEAQTRDGSGVGGPGVGGPGVGGPGVGGPGVGGPGVGGPGGNALPR